MIEVVTHRDNVRLGWFLKYKGCWCPVVVVGGYSHLVATDYTVTVRDDLGLHLISLKHNFVRARVDTSGPIRDLVEVCKWRS